MILLVVARNTVFLWCISAWKNQTNRTKAYSEWICNRIEEYLIFFTKMTRILEKPVLLKISVKSRRREEGRSTSIHT